MKPEGSRAARRRRWEWAVYGCMLALILVALGHVLVQERGRAFEAERERLAAQARVVDDNFARQLDGIHGALGSLRDEFGVPAAARSAHAEAATRRLMAWVASLPGVRTMLITDADGTVWAASRGELVGRNVAMREFFTTPRAHRDGSVLYLSQPFRTDLGVFTMNAARAIMDGDRFVGVVSASLDQTYAEVVLRSILYAPDMHAELIHGSGALFMRMPPSADASSPDEMVGLLDAHLRSGRSVTSTQGPGGLVALRTMHSMQIRLHQPMVVAVGRPYASIDRPWLARVSIYALLCLLGAAVGALALYVAQRARSERERAEMQRDAERRRDAERLELTLTGADVGLWDWDLPSGRIIFNERWYAMLGYGRDELEPLVRNWLAQVHPDDRGELHRRLDAHLRHKRGYWIWVLDRGKVMERGDDGEPVRMVGAQMDVTERRRAEEALRESEARFRSLTELSSDWYWELDDQYRFVRFEGYAGRHAGTPRQSDIGLTRWDLGAINMTESDWERHRAVLDARETFHDFELQRMEPDGTIHWVSLSGAPIFDAHGVFRGYRGVGRNITERKRAEDEIERLAFYDALTGLPNRRLLHDRLHGALGRSLESHQHGALLFIDLDNFKDLNDTLGHDVGDSLLERVANRLVTCVRTGDTVARLGGDEFVVMMENLGADEAAAEGRARIVARKVLDALNHPYVLDGYEHHSTPSIGVTLFGGSRVQGVDEALKRADLAMYQAKAAGRNTIIVFHPDMQTAVSSRSALETDLRHALANGELRLYYQPVVDAQQRLLGAEALLRWLHPARGMVSPGDFIPLAEQTGLILPIGRWVLESACAQLVLWAAQPATRGFFIAVNVSARQFRQSDFVAEVADTLARSGATPQRLKLELTESLLLGDIEDAVAKMGQLKDRGVGFSLDDFGTGYSSLSYLKRLPLDQLKIDQSFVRDVLTDANDAAIVRTILALAQSLDLQVVAEGVENEGQHVFLREHGCRAFQGYLFGRPAPPADMLAAYVPGAAGGVTVDIAT
ncbi:bifunctional diguanylate cyclase/phosphodiesterase [Xylophilus sp.]|uniref:bifunctional diguanylate cyclase/phosphodiesterase n=1 Tax=Xylophilus sp. TaxID=2653893 RepID=UPI0013BCD1C4|nr:EAL domain-containing protein [Xylophilus sp.]KAF1047824.1 MAG: putative signaling protein [Xylophilus sp.]